MKHDTVVRSAFLALVVIGIPLMTGCYTRLATDKGDYWGYSGHARRQRVVVQPQVAADTIYSKDSTQPDTVVIDDARTRDDQGYNTAGTGQTIINNYYNSYDPWYDYYPYRPYRPAVSFSVTLGLRRGWSYWYDYTPYPYYPDGYYYDTWYDPFWYYPYPVWPSYWTGRYYYDSPWWGHRGFDRRGRDWDHNSGNSGSSNPNHRVGRITGGESQTGGGANPSGTPSSTGRALPSRVGSPTNPSGRVTAPSKQPSVSGGRQPAGRSTNDGGSKSGRVNAPSNQTPQSSGQQPNAPSRVQPQSPPARVQPSSPPARVQPPVIRPSNPNPPENTSEPSNSGQGKDATPPQRANPRPNSEMNRGIGQPQSYTQPTATGRGSRRFVVIHRNSGGTSSQVRNSSAAQANWRGAGMGHSRGGSNAQGTSYGTRQRAGGRNGGWSRGGNAGGGNSGGGNVGRASSGGGQAPASNQGGRAQSGSVGRAR